ncbi:MAG: uncharacterized protein KVP18_002331 [Porospora cf. gigantea A]|uniref:uncharacterized protein n=1 Tax=Porospora cf. gigantea A TaxID=2853593 RepID=UPI00355A7A64|nr:MAG: hypothetical protein KVP18_002331 [Porospora cf. gigantea A]
MRLERKIAMALDDVVKATKKTRKRPRKTIDKKKPPQKSEKQRKYKKRPRRNAKPRRTSNPVNLFAAALRQWIVCRNNKTQ